MSHCAVIGCRSKQGMPERRFHRLPFAKNRGGSKALAITRARQQAWQAALKRSKWFGYKLRTARVCDLHFISGKPAKANDLNSPDWAPTLNLENNEPIEETKIKSIEESMEEWIETEDYHELKEEPEEPEPEPEEPEPEPEEPEPEPEEPEPEPEIVAKPRQVFIVMDNPESPIDFSKMCRLCMSKNVLLMNLHPAAGVKVKSASNNILNIIKRFTTIKIIPTDKLPQKICQNCVQTLNTMLAFQNKCKRSDTELQKMKLSMDISDDQPDIKVEIIDDDDDLTVADKEQKQVINTVNMESEDENDFTFRDETTHDSASSDITDDSCRIKEAGEDFEKSKITDQPSAAAKQRVACDICGKLYDRFHLQYHMNTHTGLKPFQCGMGNCNAKFAAPHSLRKHKQLCHSDYPRSHICDVCGRGFKLSGALKMHRSYHFDPELPCTVCKKLFRNKRALKKHMLHHSQERNFKCDVCKKSYQTRYTLRIHKRVHTQEKPYSCFCGLSFAYKCLLKSHSEKYHKEVNGKTDEQPNELPPPIVSSS